MKNQWFRMYSEAVDDEKLRLLAFEDRWHFVALMCCKNAGLLDAGDSLTMLHRKLAVKLGVQLRELEAIGARLAEVGLIDAETFQPLAWDARQFQSDSSADRVRKHREKKRQQNQMVEGHVTQCNEVKRYSNVTVTPSDTETETDTDNSLSLRSRESGRAQTVEPEINTAKPRRSQTGTRLPDGWEPSDEDVAFARRERPDVDWRAEADGFRDYWHAKAGAGARKVDWSATWRNWIRRADGMRKPAQTRQQAPAAPGKTMQALMALEAMKHGNELDSDGNFAGLPTAGLLGS